MELERANREQYEHILAQAAQLDRAAQQNLLLDLAAQIRRAPEPETGRPSRLFGMLAGKGISTEAYERQKQLDKELE